MPQRRQLMLPFPRWPIEDQRRWQFAFRSDGLFGESGPGARLAQATRQFRLESYGRFLGFLSVRQPNLLGCPPEKRIDQQKLVEYVAWRRRSCGDASLAADLRSLRSALNLICPDSDWSWVQSIANENCRRGTAPHAQVKRGNE